MVDIRGSALPSAAKHNKSPWAYVDNRTDTVDRLLDNRTDTVDRLLIWVPTSCHLDILKKTMDYKSYHSA